MQKAGLRGKFCWQAPKKSSFLSSTFFMNWFGALTQTKWGVEELLSHVGGIGSPRTISSIISCT